jgi:thiol-disulfide isomerase/thioredoxin
MLERLLIVTLLIAAGVAAYCAFRSWHVRRAQAAAPTDPILRESKPGVPTIVYFTTPGCVPCKTQQQPALQKLQERLGEQIHIVKIDAAEQPEAAERWGVFTAPTTFVVDGRGQVREVNHGVAGTDHLLRQIELAQAA